MANKYQKLLLKLNESGDWTTASALAEYVDVSERSIKNYIKQINHMYGTIILSSRNGYQLKKDVALQELLEKEVPQTIDERINYILWKLLIKEETPDIFDLCEELYISENTLKSDLIKIRRKLKQMDLLLINDGGILSIKGSERNRRRMISEIIYDESKDNFLNLSIIQAAFPYYDVELIEQIVKQSILENHFYINDFSLINLVLHITIALNALTHSPNMDNVPSLHTNIAYKIAVTIAHRLEKQFSLTISSAEIQELSLLLFGSLTIAFDDPKQAQLLFSHIGSEYLHLVDLLTRDLKEHYYITFHDEDFKIRLALHLRNMLHRVQKQIYGRNPLTNSIKSQCPFIYDCAVHIAHRIMEIYQHQFVINDDEIAYIAFHIGNELELQKIKDYVIKATLLYPDYYHMGQNLLEQLNHRFTNRLWIEHVIESPTKIDPDTFDLLISIVPIHNDSFPFVLISPFLSDSDQSQIEKKIDVIYKQRKLDFIHSYLPTVFLKELFEINTSLSSAQETIHYMCDKLFRMHFVDSDFEQDILNREDMSSTAFYDIAIPHSMKMNSIKTTVSVLISPTGIHWEGQLVHLVILLSISKAERKNFRNLFDTITTALTEPKNRKALTQALTYEEFLNALLTCMNQ